MSRSMKKTSVHATVRGGSKREKNFRQGGRTLLAHCGQAFAAACLGFLLASPDPGWAQDSTPDGFEDLYEAIRKVALSKDVNGLGYNQAMRDQGNNDAQIFSKPRANAIERKTIAAYFWGITLVEMARTQDLILWQYTLAPNDLYTPSGINEGDSVVNPNVDVLYVQGFIDFQDPSLSESSRALVLTIPDTDPEDSGRGVFNVMQVLDAYTQVVGSYGTRGSPDEIDRGDDVTICLLPENIPTNKGADVLLSGPDYNDGIPVEFQDSIVAECKISTNQVWLIGRVAVDSQTQQSDSDYLTLRAEANSEFLNELSVENALNNFSYHYALTPLQDYPDLTPTKRDDPKEGSREAPDFDANNPLNHDFFNQDSANPNVAASASDVEEHPDAAPFWSSQDFFQYVGKSIVQNGVPGGDALLLSGFEDIGLSAENGYVAPDESTQSEMNQALVKAANFLGWIKDGNLPAPPEWAGNWNTSTDLGYYERTSSGWIKAAILAAVGLGANLGEDGVYPLMNEEWDEEGTVTSLNGANNYQLILDPRNDSESGVPPVMLDSTGQFPMGYWAVTVYDSDFRIVESSEEHPFYGGQVYSLGSTQLEVLRGENPVTSSAVTFYLQHNPPDDESKLRYWLPVPEDDFNVVLRVYAPDMNHFPIPYADGPQDAQGEVWPGVDEHGDLPPGFVVYAPPDLVSVPEPAHQGVYVLAVLGTLAAFRRVQQA